MNRVAKKIERDLVSAEHRALALDASQRVCVGGVDRLATDADEEDGVRHGRTTALALRSEQVPEGTPAFFCSCGVLYVSKGNPDGSFQKHCEATRGRVPIFTMEQMRGWSFDAPPLPPSTARCEMLTIGPRLCAACGDGLSADDVGKRCRACATDEEAEAGK